MGSALKGPVKKVWQNKILTVACIECNLLSIRVIKSQLYLMNQSRSIFQCRIPADIFKVFLEFRECQVFLSKKRPNASLPSEKFVKTIYISLFFYQLALNAKLRSKYEVSQIWKWFCGEDTHLIEKNLERKPEEAYDWCKSAASIMEIMLF